MRQRPRFLVVAALVVALVAGLSVQAAAQGQGPEIVPERLRIRAFGDAMTAGFGIDSSGALLPTSDRSECRSLWIGDGSATTAGTRCSSNGSNGPGSPPDEIAFSADFGLANGASWAAQVARGLGTVDFANYAVSGSTLVSWLNLPPDEAAPAEGRQHDLLDRISRDDPDIVLASLGGEVLLQQTSGPIRTCALLIDEATQWDAYVQCVEEVLFEQKITQRLMAVAFDVLADTRNAKLLFTLYETPAPSVSALMPWQQQILTREVNFSIVAAATGVAESGASWASRIDVVRVPAPPACIPSVVPAPSTLGQVWWSPTNPCSASFTPVSGGTVPGIERQAAIAAEAVKLVRAKRWA